MKKNSLNKVTRPNIINLIISLITNLNSQLSANRKDLVLIIKINKNYI